MIKHILKRILSRRLILFYHKVLAKLANFVYGKPSQKMIVIGVTGTSGKSTVVNLIAKVLEENGLRVGLTTTFNFKIGRKEWVNKTKMTMLGRFALQRLLAKMLKEKCQYAIIETSSQGILQSRHLGIDYDIVVFTNLSPEHIEAHGGFEKYKVSKGKLFARLHKMKIKKINGKIIKKIIIANLDDSNVDYFLQFPADKKYGYTIGNNDLKKLNYENLKIVKAQNIQSGLSGSKFQIFNSMFQINLIGKFNVYNSLAAICLGDSQGINLEICKRALSKVKKIPGRMEIIISKPFTVIVDYAHTPDSLEKVYKTLRPFARKLIAVFGSAGGGRDKWKRPKLGEIANNYCDKIIITNEDPYDEDPEKIISQIYFGIKDKSKIYKILDRKEAIRKALSLAQKNDIVIITGKGSEQCIVSSNGERIKWDDRKIVKELIKE